MTVEYIVIVLFPTCRTFCYNDSLIKLRSHLKRRNVSSNTEISSHNSILVPVPGGRWGGGGGGGGRGGAGGGVSLRLIGTENILCA